MPARFKGMSEYDRNFRWKTGEIPHGRFSPDQNRTWAGLRSDQLGITKEPGFISKKKVPYYDPQISKSFDWPGDQDTERNAPVLSEVKAQEHVEPRAARQKFPNYQEKVETPRVETPRAPRVPVKKPRSRSADSRMQYAKENKAETANKSRRAHNVREPKNAAASKPQSPRQGREHKADVDNRAHPQVLEKPTHGPAPTQPGNESERFLRALQKKAGMNVAPVHKANRTTEYNRQFVWKKPFRNSPMLAAEQVIYNKNSSIQPIKKDIVPRVTEYHTQFKGLSPAKGPKLRRDWEEKEGRLYVPEDISPEKKNKKEEYYPSKEKQPGSAHKHANQRKKSREQYLQKHHFPHRGYRKATTEYAANFVSPEEYRYRKGSWIRIRQQAPDEVKELRAQAESYRHRVLGTHFSRDHLNQILSKNNKLWEAASSTSTDEMLSANIKALDLAGSRRTAKPAGLSPDERRRSLEKDLPQMDSGGMGEEDASSASVRRRLVWEEDGSGEQITPIAEEDEQDEVNSEEDGVEPAQQFERNNANLRIDERKQGEDMLSPADSETISEPSTASVGEGGRLPTPQLKSLGGPQRTHHDLTTPVIGGAVLVSPPKLKSQTPDRRKKTSPERRYSPHKRVPRESPRRELVKNKDVLMRSPHAAGVKTVDPLPLREDQWPILDDCDKLSPVKPRDEDWNMSPSQRALVISKSPHRSQSCRIHGALRDPEFQHNGNIASYNQFRLPLYEMNSADEDDDRMSQISARSAASSSLAVQTLQRAQKRKEHFWGKR
ncbi:nuclear protein MDM1 isoform X2 [Ambystoma mexicanum]|uniref:nuclear protein MDM1 isoform X2 n=1 Tax=Ambystoma mexicanum TaxID=8296 RepID=UPI0037E99E35